MLEHDTCPGRADFSLAVSWRRVRRWVSVGGRGKKSGGCSAVPPRSLPRTRCHQAQLGTSLGHQRVYYGFPSAAVCVQPLSGRTPRDGPVSPVALFLSLIPFHSPMRRTRPTSHPPFCYQRFVCAPPFLAPRETRCSRLRRRAITPVIRL